VVVLGALDDVEVVVAAAVVVGAMIVVIVATVVVVVAVVAGEVPLDPPHDAMTARANTALARRATVTWCRPRRG
jgi:hypothetical protein